MAILQPLEESCPKGALAAFSEAMGSQIFRVNVLVLTNAFLVGVLVGMGAYLRRYRHHQLARYIFRGAAILFLPIISYVVSSISNQYIISLPFEGEILIGRCDPRDHIFLVLVWTGLVQVVGINYTTTVVATDGREAGRGEAPPVLLLVYAFWTGYLSIYTGGRAGYTRGFYFPEFVKNVLSLRGLLVVLLFDLIFAKMVLMFYAFYMAKRSYALGRNPRLIVGYMKKLQRDGRKQRAGGEQIPPSLIVAGEDTLDDVDKHPHGYCPRSLEQGGEATMKTNKRGLLTVDKVWQCPDMSDSEQLKDVCFSFALFKLLRCRFARYTISKAHCNEVHNFIWNEYLKDGDSDYERFLKVIVDELSFLNDYYYSSHPIFYSEHWLHIFGLVVSILSIGYCLLLAALQIWTIKPKKFWQIPCQVQCRGNSKFQGYGNLVFDLVPVFLLLALVILSEIRDIASYIYSNWNKIGLIGRSINHPSKGKCSMVQKCVNHMLQYRCEKLLKNWENKMSLCSVLVLHPRKNPMYLLRCVFPRLPEEKKYVKVPNEVKTSLFETLRISWEQLKEGIPSLPPTVQIDDKVLGEFTGTSTIEYILGCHIATSILEVRHPNYYYHKVVATYLSCYCAYLVAYNPELLPDDNKWSKSLYRLVKKDAKRALNGRITSSVPEDKYQQLVKLLSKEKNYVLKDGVELGKALVEHETASAWQALACFWLKMLLYVAPSDNQDCHAEAVARGGELITLLWALLGHAGIINRPDSDDTTTPSAAQGVV